MNWSSQGPGQVVGALALACQLLGCGSQDPPSGPRTELAPTAARAAQEGERAKAGALPPDELIRGLESPEREARLRAVAALSGSDSPEALQALIDLLKREPDPEIRGLAQAAVTGWQDPKLREHMELALHARVPRVRAKAAAGLAEIGAEESISALEAALESEGDASVRAALRSALATLKGEREAQPQ